MAGYEFLQLDFAVLATTAALGAGATLFFSLLPALQASRAAVADALRQGGRTVTLGRTRRWLGTALAAGQVALTLALVVASALILGAVDGAVNGVLGFDKHHVMTARLTLPERPYAEQEARRQFVDRVLARLEGMPAVESMGAVSFLPYAGTSSSRPVHPEGTTLSAAEVRQADYQRATPGYFAAMRIPILEGRRSASPIRTTRDPSRWSIAASRIGTGRANRRWAVDSASPTTRPGWRSWGSPATSCTTGSWSSAGPRSTGPSARTPR
ncbi:MAG: hypothetical protein R2712_27730 [Vicinamibacterales bacterium]